MTEHRIRSANAATVVAYPFAGLAGYCFAKAGIPVWYTLVVLVIASAFSNWVAGILTRRQNAKLAAFLPPEGA